MYYFVFIIGVWVGAAIVIAWLIILKYSILTKFHIGDNSHGNIQTDKSCNKT